jgi:hypothetical protein
MIEFKKTEFSANFTDAAGKPLKRVQQVRTDPVTLKQCRITPSRALENERGTEERIDEINIIPDKVASATDS